MSGNERQSSDRRVERSRAALLSAFNRLILERGFDSLTAAEVADAANVGRSTFYAHYTSLADLLSVAIGPILTPLANAAVREEPQLTAMLDHVWENRVMARKLLAGDNRRQLVQLLASKIEALLAKPAQADAPIAGLTALRIAGGQLAVLEYWLSGRAAGTAADIARVLQDRR